MMNNCNYTCMHWYTALTVYTPSQALRSTHHEGKKGRERYLQGICRRAASLSSVPGGVQVVLMHAETIKPLLSHLDEKNKNNIRVAVFGNSLPTPTPHHCNHYTNVSNTKVQLHTSSQTWRFWVLVLQQLLQFHAVLGLQCRELLYFGLKNMPNISCILEVKLNFCLSNSLQLPVQLYRRRETYLNVVVVKVIWIAPSPYYLRLCKLFLSSATKTVNIWNELAL